mmetsp:Transcript_23270/g.72792  ORF Transcript_23270/g.72792 Transcript_23270/m.72792 type:complete len:467 (-) Transcript_23270:659-2059(-)
MTAGARWRRPTRRWRQGGRRGRGWGGVAGGAVGGDPRGKVLDRDQELSTHPRDALEGRRRGHVADGVPGDPLVRIRRPRAEGIGAVEGEARVHDGVPGLEHRPQHALLQPPVALLERHGHVARAPIFDRVAAIEEVLPVRPGSNGHTPAVLRHLIESNPEVHPRVRAALVAVRGPEECVVDMPSASDLALPLELEEGVLDDMEGFVSTGNARGELRGRPGHRGVRRHLPEHIVLGPRLQQEGLEFCVRHSRLAPVFYVDYPLEEVPREQALHDDVAVAEEGLHLLLGQQALDHRVEGWRGDELLPLGGVVAVHGGGLQAPSAARGGRRGGREHHCWRHALQQVMMRWPAAGGGEASASARGGGKRGAEGQLATGEGATSARGGGKRSAGGASLGHPAQKENGFTRPAEDEEVQVAKWTANHFPMHEKCARRALTQPRPLSFSWFQRSPCVRAPLSCSFELSCPPRA